MIEEVSTLANYLNRNNVLSESNIAFLYIVLTGAIAYLAYPIYDMATEIIKTYRESKKST